MAGKQLSFSRECWKGIWEQAFQEKRTLCLNMPLSVPEGHIPISRALVVPIIDHDEVIGNIMAANKKTDYDAGDISLLEAITDYLAPVLREKLQRDTEGKKRRQAEEERLEMERRLHHAQRLESLGILAGGIAHDFNNLLMAIMGNLEMVKLEIPSSSKAQAYLDASMNSSLRAADITRQMLAYSGKGRFLIRDVELCTLIEEMLPLLESSLSKTAFLQLDLCRPLPVILADAGQLRQILMNLVINASEAIGEQPGTITLKTGVISCDDAFLLRSRLEEKPHAGRFVDLQIADTGCGMDSATCDRLFDPFFTTKFTGRGLGMSAVLGIVRGHGGALMVDSEPGKGTIVRILFPLKEGFENTDATNASEEIFRKES
jgi:signal transduction histidine kinase